MSMHLGLGVGVWQYPNCNKYATPPASLVGHYHCHLFHRHQQRTRQRLEGLPNHCIMDTAYCACSSRGAFSNESAYGLHHIYAPWVILIASSMCFLPYRIRLEHVAEALKLSSDELGELCSENKSSAQNGALFEWT